MIYWRRYCGDYLRDTADLTLIEHGIYTILLDHYYATEHPLCADLKPIARQIRAYSKVERRALESVLNRYFPLNGDGTRHNKRADQEILIAQQAIAKMSAAGKAGARQRWDSPPHNAPHSPPYNPPDANAMGHPTHPSTINLQPSTRSNPLSADALGAFEQFWEAYPNKKDKKKAAKAFAKIKPDQLPAILEAIAEQKASDQWQRGFIPHPTTWLNGERWQDETPTIESSELGQCAWNRNGTRELGQGQCPNIATVETPNGPYCRSHAPRINVV